MWFRLSNWWSDKKREFWRSVSKFAMRKAYFWWDYSYLFAHMHDWFEYASKRYKERGVCASSDNTSRQLAVASEICKRLSTGYIEENAYNVVFGPKHLRRPITFPFKPTEEESRKYRRLHEFEQQSYKYHLELLTKLISKHSLTWWD